LMGNVYVGLGRLEAGSDKLELRDASRSAFFAGQTIEVSGQVYEVVSSGAAVIELRVFSATSNVSAVSGSTGSFRLQYQPPTLNSGDVPALRYSSCIPIVHSPHQLEEAVTALLGVPVSIESVIDTDSGREGVGIAHQITFSGSLEAASARNTIGGIVSMFSIDPANALQAGSSVC